MKIFKKLSTFICSICVGIGAGIIAGVLSPVTIPVAIGIGVGVGIVSLGMVSGIATSAYFIGKQEGYEQQNPTSKLISTGEEIVKKIDALQSETKDLEREIKSSYVLRSELNSQAEKNESYQKTTNAKLGYLEKEVERKQDKPNESSKAKPFKKVNSETPSQEKVSPTLAKLGVNASANKESFESKKTDNDEVKKPARKPMRV